jgi:hypothetical protein
MHSAISLNMQKKNLVMHFLCINIHYVSANIASFAIKTTTMSIAKNARKIAECGQFFVANIEMKKALFDRI